ncbi:Hint domain-containing protein [Pseudaestuariivita rosea]|uniref:Hint domain-containing protein n=1 Tax=Pseudaestuariivita rosea TaxID=2763263 RepID=UPI001ABAC905|nr:Hint domain-containing protein [Pseudaestuariivita rosea]
MLQHLLSGLASNSEIRTPCGPRRISCIRPGDLIITRDNGLQPVRMVWSYHLHDVLQPSKPRSPVCLKTRAVGPMMPMKPLILAPDHKVLVPSYLVASADDADQACFLAASGLAGSNALAYYDANGQAGEFFNLVFDHHEIIFANGLPVESFRPTVEALSCVDETARAEITARFPALKLQKTPFPAAYRTIGSAEYLPIYA